MKSLTIPITLVLLVASAAGIYRFVIKPDKSLNLDLATSYPDGLEGTEGMAALLKIKSEEFQHLKNTYANTLRYRNKLQEEPPKKFEQRLAFDLELSYRALAAGYVEEAIDIARQAVERMDAEKYRGKEYLPLLEQLGVAWFRKGELDNCLNNHNAESCILPFSENAVHKNPTGAREAALAFARILEQQPDHYYARYVLNLSMIAIGSYPQGVPEPWLIDPSKMLAGNALPRFNNVADQLGVDLVTTCGSAIVEDFNGDRILDIFTSGFGLTEQATLYLATGDGRFENATDRAGIKGITGGLNTIHADYNNDGHSDILILRGGWWNAFGHVPNSLLRNNGDGSFSDVTKEAGLLSFYPTQAAFFRDLDNDGWLDLFIANESSARSKNNPCELYRNKGDGTFESISASQSGIKAKGYIKGVAAGDYDNDGFSDFYLSMYQGDNVLYRNQGAEDKPLQFADVTASAGGLHLPYRSFPTWWFDFDNDGDLDLVSLSFDNTQAMANAIAAEYYDVHGLNEPSRIYRNNGDGTFEDATVSLGMENIMLMAMGCNYGDLNGDGWEDFYVGTGNPEIGALFPNRMFLNREGKRFEEVTMDGGFGHLQKGHAIAFADLDNNGTQDIYANMGGAWESDFFQNSLFLNPGFGNHWVCLEVEGKTSNRDANGTRVRLVLENADGSQRTLHRVVCSGGSFGGNPQRLQIGLGQAERILYAELTWPVSGEVQRLNNLPVDRFLHIVEGDTKWTELAIPSFPLGGQAPEPAASAHEHEHTAHSLP